LSILDTTLNTANVITAFHCVYAHDYVLSRNQRVVLGSLNDPFDDLNLEQD